EIAATVRGAEIAHATLTCAQAKLYDSDASARGAVRESEVYEVAGVADGAFAYKLTYRDDGDTSEGTRLSFDTFTRKALLRGVGPGDVTVRLGSQSLDRPGASKFGFPTGIYTMHRDLRML